MPGSGKAPVSSSGCSNMILISSRKSTSVPLIQPVSVTSTVEASLLSVQTFIPAQVYPCRRSRPRWPSETVAPTLDGGDDFGVGRVGFKLQPESLDEGSQVVALVRVAGTPDAMEQCPVVEHLVGMTSQLRQQLVLGGR